MKAFYVFILTVGVCFANEKTSLDSGPKPPIPQTNPAARHEEEIEGPVNHLDNVPHSNSTAKTSTSSTPAPSPTPSSTPTPTTIGKWNVTDDKGITCILLSGKIALNLVNETDSKIIHTFEVPASAPNHGNCAEERIEFDLPNNSSLHLMFGKNTTTKTYYIRAIKAKLSRDNITENFFNDTLHLFENPLDQSYYCPPPSENLVAQKPLLHLTLKVDSFQVQAFKNSTSKDFDTDVSCETPQTPDIVPIIVGCALAVLVILVLVAYLISRRRSQSRGYFSM